MANKIFDARGLMCPMPIVKLRKEILAMQLGDTIELIADDEGAWEDIPSWCEQTGNKLLSREEKEKNVFYFLIERVS